MKKLGFILILILVTQAQDCPIGNNEGDMVFVPAGKFVRGACSEKSEVTCNSGDLGYDFWVGEFNDYGSTSPVREITLNAFWIDKTEVTVAAYRECVDANVCSLPGQWQADPEDNESSYCNWGSPRPDDHPINCVYQHQAKTFCEWAGKRLPTEAEWEKAARGGCEMGIDPDLCEAGTDDRLYPWGNGEPNCLRANYAPPEIGCRDGYGTTSVGSFPAGASPYGALDMAGNVWEWVADLYDRSYYSPTYPYPDYSPSENPQGPVIGEPYELMRGGSWSHASDGTTHSLQVAYRGAYYFVPEYLPGSLDDVGFRCVKTTE